MSKVSGCGPTQSLLSVSSHFERTTLSGDCRPRSNSDNRSCTPARSIDMAVESAAGGSVFPKLPVLRQGAEVGSVGLPEESVCFQQNLRASQNTIRTMRLADKTRSEGIEIHANVKRSNQRDAFRVVTVEPFAKKSRCLKSSDANLIGCRFLHIQSVTCSRSR